MSQMAYPDYLPKEYEPLGAWKYFGYTLLFSLPIVGLIIAIIFSLNSENLHLKSFARAIIILEIIVFILVIISTLYVYSVALNF
ncbi:MAG: ABC transporter permease [Clostridia bacterium]|nr:ABC transporter permease [Clostridia bacterium]